MTHRFTQGLQRVAWDGMVRELATVWSERGQDGSVWRCFLTTHPDGWDLRLEQSGQLLRTRSFSDVDTLLRTAASWRHYLPL